MFTSFINSYCVSFFILEWCYLCHYLSKNTLHSYSAIIIAFCLTHYYKLGVIIYYLLLVVSEVTVSLLPPCILCNYMEAIKLFLFISIFSSTTLFIFFANLTKYSLNFSIFLLLSWLLYLFNLWCYFYSVPFSPSCFISSKQLSDPLESCHSYQERTFTDMLLEFFLCHFQCHCSLYSS